MWHPRIAALRAFIQATPVRYGEDQGPVDP
jgi:hypothetical protein